MEDKDIMAELQEIVDKESKRINRPTDAMSEGLAIFNNLITAFDKDLPDADAQLFIISHLSPEQVQQARKADIAKLVPNGLSEAENKGADGGKVEMVSDSIPVDEMLSFLGDFEAALVLSQWKNPAGIIARVKRKGERLQAMVLGQVLVFQKQLATGDKITKSWNTNTDEAPERDEFANGYEYKFFKNTYTHLMTPLMLKEQSPTGYELVLDMVKKRIARAIESDGDDYQGYDKDPDDVDD
jgi:hypothetical protein